MAVQFPKTIRQWFTPEQACVYLSDAFGEPIVIDDIYQFMWDFNPHLAGYCFVEEFTTTLWLAPDITNKYFLNKYLDKYEIEENKIKERFVIKDGHYKIAGRFNISENEFNVFVCIETDVCVEVHYCNYNNRFIKDIVQYKKTDEFAVIGMVGIKTAANRIRFL